MIRITEASERLILIALDRDSLRERKKKNRIVKRERKPERERTII